MKVLVLGVNSFNSKAGKPCFQGYVAMPNTDRRGYSPTTTQWLEPLEYQALERCVPCFAEGDQSVTVARDGRTEVRVQNYRDMVPLLAEKPSTSAKAS